MKLNVNGYELDIKVKAPGAKRVTEQETLSFLNFLFVVTDCSIEEMRQRGLTFTAKEAIAYRNAFYKTCDEKGVYQ